MADIVLITTEQPANVLVYNQGVQGPKGDKGDKGDTGSQGAQGNAGSVGSTGPQGIPGIKGDQGIQGTTGSTGPTGPQGRGLASKTTVYELSGSNSGGNSSTIDDFSFVKLTGSSQVFLPLNSVSTITCDAYGKNSAGKLVQLLSNYSTPLNINVGSSFSSVAMYDRGNLASSGINSAQFQSASDDSDIATTLGQPGTTTFPSYALPYLDPTTGELQFAPGAVNYNGGTKESASFNWQAVVTVTTFVL